MAGMTLRQQGILTAIGSGGGLLFGLLWYFVWGCEHCARGSSALSPVLFSALCGGDQ
jgi:hypothetical protein